MMNNEEFERKMEFVVNQQARFDANIQQLQEVQKVHEEALGRILGGLAETFEGLAETFEGIGETFEDLAETKEIVVQTTENLAQLTTLTHEGFKYTFESFKNTDAKIDALVDSQIHTDEIIRNIGTKLDRHLNQDHNSS